MFDEFIRVGKKRRLRNNIDVFAFSALSVWWGFLLSTSPDRFSEIVSAVFLVISLCIATCAVFNSVVATRILDRAYEQKKRWEEQGKC